MNVAGFRRYASGVVAALLVGCATAQSPNQAPPLLPPAERGAPKLASYVYVGECCRFNDDGEVILYDQALTAVARKITEGVTTPDFITVDRSGRLYDINHFDGYGLVIEYDRGSETPSRRINLRGAWAAATDSANNLYVASCTSCLPYGTGNGSVGVYERGTKKLLRSITKGIDLPVSVAFDTDDNLYVANASYTKPAVTVYAPGSSEPQRRLTRGLAVPSAIGLDPSNNVFVMNNPVNGSPSVVEYKAASSKVLRTISNGIASPQAIALDGSGTLYVANAPGSTGGWISVYPSGASAPSYQIKIAVNDPIALTVDGEGNLYVGNDGPDNPPRYVGTICVYASNARRPLRCVRGERRFDQPSWLAVGP